MADDSLREELSLFREDVNKKFDEIKKLLLEMSAGISGTGLMLPIPITARIELDPEMVLAHFRLDNQISNDSFLFRKFFCSEGRPYPIRKCSRGIYEFWDGASWVKNATEGIWSKLSLTMQTMYAKYNSETAVPDIEERKQIQKRGSRYGSDKNFIKDMMRELLPLPEE